MSKVIAIFIAPNAGAPMVSVASVRAVVGRGLEGDRYFLDQGTFSGSKTRQVIRHVSLISIDAIHEASKRLTSPFFPHQTRRNILTDLRVETLNDLVEKEFSVGPVRMRGVQLCKPCDLPDQLRGEEPRVFKKAFENRGGLRAEILSEGIIKEHSFINV